MRPCVCVFSIRANMCIFPHAHRCALIWLTRTDLLFVGIMLGARLLVEQFPVSFIVKKVNQSVGFSELEGNGYLLSTG